MPEPRIIAVMRDPFFSCFRRILRSTGLHSHSLHTSMFEPLCVRVICLTNSMKLSPSSEANYSSHSAHSAGPRRLVRGQPAPCAFLNHVSSLRAHIACRFKIYSNIIVPSTPRSFTWSLAFGFPQLNLCMNFSSNVPPMGDFISHSPNIVDYYDSTPHSIHEFVYGLFL